MKCPKCKHEFTRHDTHGSDSCYNSGCRCDECKKAHAKVNREAYKKKRRKGTDGPYD